MVAALLLLHGLCVVAVALPDGTLRGGLLAVKVPLPVLNTHRGELGVEFGMRGLCQTWLEWSAQYQRWAMFTPRRPNLIRVELQQRAPSGQVAACLLQRRIDDSVLRGCRWRYLESALANPRNRQHWLPVAAPALARALFADAGEALRMLKLAYPLPLLEDDGSGNPIFTTAADWRQRVAARDQWTRIEMGVVELPAQELR